jgi:hypothetical protein
MTSSDDPTRCELLLSLGEAHARAGETQAAQEAFLEAAGIARRCDLPRQLAQAAIGYGGRIVWARVADDERLIPLLEDALVVVPEDELGLRARLVARLAGALRDDVSVERRKSLSGEAVELARRSGDSEALAVALEGRSVVALGALNDLQEILTLADEIRALGEQSGDKEKVVHGHYTRAHALFEVGDSAGHVELEAAATVAAELRQPTQLWLVHAAQATILLAQGR